MLATMRAAAPRRGTAASPRSGAPGVAPGRVAGGDGAAAGRGAAAATGAGAAAVVATPGPDPLPAGAAPPGPGAASVAAAARAGPGARGARAARRPGDRGPRPRRPGPGGPPPARRRPGRGPAGSRRRTRASSRSPSRGPRGSGRTCRPPARRWGRTSPRPVPPCRRPHRRRAAAPPGVGHGPTLPGAGGAGAPTGRVPRRAVGSVAAMPYPPGLVVNEHPPPGGWDRYGGPVVVLVHGSLDRASASPARSAGWTSCGVVDLRPPRLRGLPRGRLARRARRARRRTCWAWWPPSPGPGRPVVRGRAQPRRRRGARGGARPSRRPSPRSGAYEPPMPWLGFRAGPRRRRAPGAHRGNAGRTRWSVHPPDGGRRRLGAAARGRAGGPPGGRPGALGRPRAACAVRPRSTSRSWRSRRCSAGAGAAAARTTARRRGVAGRARARRRAGGDRRGRARRPPHPSGRLRRPGARRGGEGGGRRRHGPRGGPGGSGGGRGGAHGMRVLVSGAHGLVGSALALDLEAGGHTVVRLVRAGAGAGHGASPPCVGSGGGPVDRDDARPARPVHRGRPPGGRRDRRPAVDRAPPPRAAWRAGSPHRACWPGWWPPWTPGPGCW